MKNLTISTDGNGRFSYSLEGERAGDEIGLGLDWGQIKQILRKIEPATAQGDDHITMVRGFFGVTPPESVTTASGQRNAQSNVSTAPPKSVSLAAQERRLECVRLAIQAGVAPDRVISWATSLSEWIARHDL